MRAKRGVNFLSVAMRYDRGSSLGNRLPRQAGQLFQGWSSQSVLRGRQCAHAVRLLSRHQRLPGYFARTTC